MAIPPRCLISTSIAHTEYPELYHVYTPSLSFFSWSLPILTYTWYRYHIIASIPPDWPRWILSGTIWIACKMFASLSPFLTRISSCPPCMTCVCMWFLRSSYWGSNQFHPILPPRWVERLRSIMTGYPSSVHCCPYRYPTLWYSSLTNVFPHLLSPPPPPPTYPTSPLSPTGVL